VKAVGAGLGPGRPGRGAVAEATADGRGGRLYVVATPIGNLADVTLRALDVLREVPLIAAEDTRLTRRLLVRYEIGARAVSYHARSAARREGELLEHLRGGRDLALVTDAGTPGISDPGERLVAAWAAEGGVVVPIPGPSAVLAAIAATGIAGPRWTFEGFLPRSGRERRERLARIAADDRGTVLFEAPGRVLATLIDLAAACGRERHVALCRELTKVHEDIERGTLAELAERMRDGRIPARGEFVVVVGARADDEAVASSEASPERARKGPDQPAEDSLLAARAGVERLVAQGVARGEAARRVASSTGIRRRHLYGDPGPT
jgi:16S rRNA (cytidine1402-2'-O)-methyltransferase